MKKICYIVTISLTIKAFFIPQLKRLSDSGYEVTVICSPDKNLHHILGEKIKYIPLEIPRGISFGKMLVALGKLIKIFSKEKFDFVQYSTPNAALCASLASVCTQCKIRNYHLMGFRYLGETGIKRHVLKLLEKFICQCSTNIECVSLSNYKLGVEEGVFKSNKALVIWNGSSGGVDLERFNICHRAQWRSEIRYQLGLQEKDFVFGFVGRITKDKGINEILKAFLQINVPSKLLLIGRREDVGSLDLTLYQDSLQNKNIMYIDEVQDIERYYAALDVLLLPSYREGFGNVVIEAEAMGTPVIVSKIPGPIDTIQEMTTGLFVKVKDYRDLSLKMRSLANGDIQFLPENCADFVREKFDSKVLCDHILEHKNKLLKTSMNK